MNATGGQGRSSPGGIHGGVASMNQECKIYFAGLNKLNY